MSVSAENTRSAYFAEGFVIINLEDGAQISFPVANNPRLAKASPEQLNHIELSPYGIHWPDLDEALSFAGLARGGFGHPGKG